jgi:hypothetical protein
VVLAVLAAMAFGWMWHDTLWVAAIGVGLGLFLALASVRGHRALMAVAAFVTGFGPWGFAYIFGAPYLAFAAFLLLQANRVDKTA